MTLSWSFGALMLWYHAVFSPSERSVIEWEKNSKEPGFIKKMRRTHDTPIDARTDYWTAEATTDRCSHDNQKTRRLGGLDQTRRPGIKWLVDIVWLNKSNKSHTRLWLPRDVASKVRPEGPGRRFERLRLTTSDILANPSVSSEVLNGAWFFRVKPIYCFLSM